MEDRVICPTCLKFYMLKTQARCRKCEQKQTAIRMKKMIDEMCFGKTPLTIQTMAISSSAFSPRT
jgi:hypothetical protein